jgi:hypothetical protein
VSKGKWHGVYVDDDGETDIYHPASCPWSVTFRPRTVDAHGAEVSPEMTIRSHDCDIGYELESNGNDCGLLPTEPGFYWVSFDHVTHPGGPWGPTEYSTESEWIIVERPPLIVEVAS